MKKAQTSFKPLEIDRNRTEKTRLERQAKFKIHSLEEGQKEALKYIDTVDLRLFSDDFVAYTIKHILEKHDAFKGLRISTEKTLDLLDINLSKLESLQLEFEQNVTELFWDKEAQPYTNINEADYIYYTKNEEQNKALKIAHNFIDGLEKLNGLIYIQKGVFVRMLNGLIYIDIGSSKFRVNHNHDIFNNR